MHKVSHSEMVTDPLFELVHGVLAVLHDAGETQQVLEVGQVVDDVRGVLVVVALDVLFHVAQYPLHGHMARVILPNKQKELRKCGTKNVVTSIVPQILFPTQSSKCWAFLHTTRAVVI